MCGAFFLPSGLGTLPGMTDSKTHSPAWLVSKRPKPRKAGSADALRGCSGCAYLPWASACQISIMESPGVGRPSPSSTRNERRMRAPCAPSRVRTPRDGFVVSPKLKNGPTVCDALGITCSPYESLERSGLAAAQHDVEPVTQGPFRLRHRQIEGRYQPRACLLVGNGLQNGVERQQRIVREIHLRHQARDERRPKQRKMNMRRPPRVVVIAPGIGAGLDRHEAIVAAAIRHRPARAQEIGIERRLMIVRRMPVTARAVRLPHFHQRVRDGPAVLIENAPRHDDALALRRVRAVPRKIVVGFTDWVVAVERPRPFR